MATGAAAVPRFVRFLVSLVPAVLLFALFSSIVMLVDVKSAPAS